MGLNALTVRHNLASFVTATLLAVPSLSAAITLGEIDVHSAFGQPLRATIPVTISSGEALTKNCIYQPAITKSPDELKIPGDLDIRFPLTAIAGTHAVEIEGYNTLIEPMYEIVIKANCSGSSTITRDFVVLLGIPGVTPLPQSVAAKTETSSSTDIPKQPAAKESKRPEPIIRPESEPEKPQSIPVSSNYRVNNGDTVSTIATRIKPAWGSLEQRTTALFLDNPAAFYNDDPAQMIAGALLVIPAKMPGPRGNNGSSGSKKESKPESPASGALPTTTPPTAESSAVKAGAVNVNSNIIKRVPQSATRPEDTVAAPDAPAEIAEATTMAEAFATANEAALEARRTREAREAEALLAEQPPSNTIQTEANNGINLTAIIAAGLLTLAVIAGVVIVLKRSRQQKRDELQAFKNNVHRYAENDNVRDAYIAPVSEPEPDEIIVNEDEDEFRKTIASDHMATSAFQRMEDQKLIMAGDNADTSDDQLEDTADELPKANVNGTFLDSNQDIFDATAATTESSMIEGASVQEIFDEALFADSDDPDATSEDLIKAAKDATENLQRLAKTAEEQEDAGLSETLVEALNLLEQDYRDELSASQILEKSQADLAISNQGKAETNKS